MTLNKVTVTRRLSLEEELLAILLLPLISSIHANESGLPLTDGPGTSLKAMAFLSSISRRCKKGRKRKPVRRIILAKKGNPLCLK
jgi:hypothetical protein